MTRLHLDIKADTAPLEPVWSFGVNCQAGLLRRKDVRRQLLTCRDELGFRHVRCRGMLDAGMGMMRADGSVPFDQSESALDWLLENGLVPFIELRGDAAAETDPRRWADLVRAFAVHVDGRYGCDARAWYFEIAPAPAVDLADAGPAYFSQYDLAAQAIKQVHHDYRVGGPAAAGRAPLAAFLEHLAKPAPEGSRNGAACDFVTVRGALEGLGGFATEARQQVTAALGQETTLLADGWEQGAAGEDGCSNAAALTAAAVELASVFQGILHPAVSDVDAETDARFEPFHNGRGLITVNDVRKASFNACHLLHQHSGFHCQRLAARWEEPVPGLGCLVTRSEYTLRLLAWFNPPPSAKQANQPVGFKIEGLPDSLRHAQIEVIRPGAGSAFEAWVQMGRPPFINREVLDAIESASQAAQAEVDFREYPPRLEPGMVMQLTLQLPFDDAGLA